MGGINPCNQLQHKPGAGEHGEKLSLAIFQGFSMFFEAHSLIEKAIIGENHENVRSAVRHGTDAGTCLTKSYDHLCEATFYLNAYASESNGAKDVEAAMVTLDATSLKKKYLENGVIIDGDEWQYVSNVMTKSGFQLGYKSVEDHLEGLKTLTLEALNTFDKVPDLCSELQLEKKIRHNGFGFIHANQKLLTSWLKAMSAYQYLCLISLESFAVAHEIEGPIG